MSTTGDSMRTFKVEDTAAMIDTPESGKHLLGAIVVVIPIGGFGIENDAIVVRTETGTMLFLKEPQLVPVERYPQDAHLNK
jgi:hypothetical protein